MGLEIVSLTIRQITDKQGYLEALGRPRTAQVKRDAIRGEAEAEREAKAARYAADTAIEESRRDYEIQKSLVQGRGPAGRAPRPTSPTTSSARSPSSRCAPQELQVEIVERQKAIELMEAEVQRRVNELEAEVIEPAKAEARKIEALAEARKEELAAQGAGEADAVRLRGHGRGRDDGRQGRAPGASTTRRRSPIACSRSCPSSRPRSRRRWRRPRRS